MLFLLFALISVFLVFVFLTKPKYREPELEGCQTGDLFFSVGDSWESYAVRILTSFRERNLVDSTPSHCGIILMEEGKPMLVHASTVAKKIVKEEPHEYITKNGSFMIYPHSHPYALDTALLRKDINDLLERNYPFDFEFNHRDTNALYCTEMVIYLFERNGINQLSDLRERSYMYPQDVRNRIVRDSEK